MIQRRNHSLISFLWEDIGKHVSYFSQLPSSQYHMTLSDPCVGHTTQLAVTLHNLLSHYTTFCLEMGSLSVPVSSCQAKFKLQGFKPDLPVLHVTN